MSSQSEERPGAEVSGPWAEWREAVDLDEYHTRWARAEAAGRSSHGEADLVMYYAPSTVLDAGCGMGRVGIELARRGIDVQGVDLDDALLDYARADAPHIRWHRADLASFSLDSVFDIVAMAGNVLVFCEPANRGAAVASCAAHLRTGGLLIAGFTLAAAVGPTAVQPMVLTDYDGWCAAAGLELVDRFATWERAPFDGGDYAVSVHRLV